MPDTTRTFLAIVIPDSLSAKLAWLQSRLAHDIGQGSWEVAKPWHLTLAFLGDVAHSDLISVCRAASDVASKHSRFSLKIQGAGAFPDATQPRVVWTGLAETGLDALQALQIELTEALMNLGFPRDRLPFRPHITLGRLKHGRGPAVDLTRILKQFDTWSTTSFAVEEIVAFSSTSTSDGPEYAAIGRSRLALRKS